MTALKEYTSSVSPKGQITVPAEIREALGIKPRDVVSIIWDDDGTVRLAPARYPDLASLRGAAGKLATPMSWPEMRDVGREDALGASQEPAE